MTGLLSNYLGNGPLADRPAVPEIFPNTLAIYRDESGDVSVWDEVTEAWVNLIPEPEPFPDLSGFLTDAPDDAFLYVRGQKKWVILPAYPDVDVLEAPQDGKQYVRKDGDWTAFVLPEIPDAGIEEAPADGKLYGRKDSAWVEVTGGGGGGEEGIPIAYKFWRAEQMTADNAGFTSIADFRFLDELGAEITPYTASATQAYSGYPLAQAFDADPYSFYAAAQGGVFVQLEYPEPVAVFGLSIGARNTPGETPNVATIRASNDGVAWTTIVVLNFRDTGAWAAIEKRTRPIPATYRKAEYIEDAPKDGQNYVRKNGAWVVNSGGGGGGGVNPFGVIPLVQPDFSTFTEYKSNPAIATKLTVAEGRTHIAYTKADNNFADDDGMAMMRAAPSTPTWEVVACVTIPMVEQTYVFCGIAGKRGGDGARLYGNAYFNDRFLTASMYTCVIRNGGGWTNIGDVTKASTQDTRRWWRLQKNATNFVYSESRDGLIWETLWDNSIGDTGDWTEVGLAICTRLGGSYPPRNPSQLAWNVHHFSVNEGLSPQ